MKVYLAGKITKHGWRFDLVKGLRSARDWKGSFPVLHNAIFEEHDYVGPFFVACDHGCYHGEATHGVGLDHDYGEIESARDLDRQTVVNLCFQAIQSADLIFAWLDNDTAYGSLVEIGYALGQGKPVYVCFAPDQALMMDMWFAATSAIRVMAENPTDGLVLALHQNRFRDRRN